MVVMNIGILFIGTGKYIKFFEKYYENCEKYFLPNLNKTYFCFTDAEFEGDVPENIKVIPTEHETWPHPTLKRFSTILSKKDEYLNFDYLFYLDADMLVNETILEEEFLFDFDYTAVQHPGYYKKNVPLPYERRSESQACVNVGGEIYWQGSFWGGKPSCIIELCEVLSNRVNIDLEKGIIALWWDESHMNKFFLEHEKRVNTLGPQYSFPESYDTDTDNNYSTIDPNNRKIIHLLKNPDEIRT